ncbi:uncharacterized protein LOC118192641 [Stegodyphus dumicola]|uniref:uncharacterized protein LOC118192641 n=1 Tax=Stegodyphus dumicola TaxID=202533 RepID=UPI0015A930E0|nr:uncharacterized protein LOC118192641 [Stegodyphus dumicola]
MKLNHLESRWFLLCLVLCILCSCLLQEGTAFLEMSLMKELVMQESAEKTKERIANLAKTGILPSTKLDFKLPEYKPLKQKHHVRNTFEEKSGSKIIKVPYPVHTGNSLKPWEKTIDNFLKLKLYMMEQKMKTKRYQMKTLYKKHKSNMFKEMMKEKFKPILIPVGGLLPPGVAPGMVPGMMPGMMPAAPAPGMMMPPGAGMMMPPPPPAMGRANSEHVAIRQPPETWRATPGAFDHDESYEEYENDRPRKRNSDTMFDDEYSDEYY